MECQVQGSIGDIEEGGGRRFGRLAAALGAALGAIALFAGGAQASTVTVGSVLPPGGAPVPFGDVQTFFNTALPEKGANLASPVGGAVLRWRALGLKGGPFVLRVLHPNGKGAYEATATSLPAVPAGEGLQTFSTNLPIHTGDLIGIDPTSGTDEIGVVETAGASYGTLFPTPFNGATVPPREIRDGKEVLLSAEVQPAPEITEVTPSSGSVKGGAEVTITGASFSGASAVNFGTAAASNVTVDSDTEITATVPAVAKPGKVDITVTTVAGTSDKVRADTFTYTACVVPGLVGKKLAKAKRKLRGAGCKVGHVKKVRGPARKAGRVVKQRPKAGRVLAPGARVKVNVVRK